MVKRWQGVHAYKVPAAKMSSKPARQSFPRVQSIQEPPKLLRQSLPPAHHLYEPPTQHSFTPTRHSLPPVPPTPDIARKVMRM
jgi:hypothetical protein